jgi:carbon-monoxide dehydrogenase large subunit
MAIVHSPYAHAVIKSIDPSDALKMPGVVRVVTGAEIADKMMRLPVIMNPGGADAHFLPHPYGLPGAQTVLATDKARYVGEWVAVVLAETRDQAYAAVPAVKVDYEPLPVVTTAEDALKDGAPQLHETIPGNFCMHVAYGDKDAAQAAVDSAEVVVRQKIHIPRQIHNATETRASLASYEPGTGEFTLWTNTQIPAGNRLMIANLIMGIPYTKLRVIAPNIGGAFGSKGYMYQDAPLTLFLARMMGRPIKWVDTRTGLYRTTVHARGQDPTITLAGSRDGKLSAMMITNYADLGAYSAHNGPGAPGILTARSTTGAYAIPHPFYEAYLAYANTVMNGPARGAGRMEAELMIERAIEMYARECGLDPAEVRRINFPKPEDFPFENGLGWTYDSGNYAGALDRALEMVGYGDREAKKAEAKSRGKRLGYGIASYVTIAGVGPSGRMAQLGLIGSTWGSALLRIHSTGDATLVTGAQPHGQGQVTTFSQVVTQELGIPVEKVEVLHSDTLGTPYAQGSYGSRSFSVEGVAVHQAAQVIKAKAMKVGAYMLEASEDDVIFQDGQVQVKGVPEKNKSLADIAQALWLAWDLPAGVEPGLETTAYFDPADFNFPFGSHVAVVEIDEQTGAADLVRYVAVDDVGNVANPGVVDGQMHGSIGFGVGPALMEELLYDEKGQFVTSGYRTYAVPRPSQLPNYELDRTVTPTPLNAMGAKGAGDISQPAVAPAIVNAVLDALDDLGVRHLDIPVTPEKIWRVLQQGVQA